MSKEKHKHDYQPDGQRTTGPNVNGEMITYSFFKCMSKVGTCDKQNKMVITRWKEKK